MESPSRTTANDPTTTTTTTKTANSVRVQSKLNPQSAAFSSFQPEGAVASSSSNPYPFDQPRPHPSALIGTTYAKHSTRNFQQGMPQGGGGGGGGGGGINGYAPYPMEGLQQQQHQRFMSPPPPDQQQHNWGGPPNAGRVEGGWIPQNTRFYAPSMPPPPPPPPSRSMPPNPQQGRGIYFPTDPPNSTGLAPPPPLALPPLLPAFQPTRSNQVEPPYRGPTSVSPSSSVAPSPFASPFASPRARRPQLPPPSETPALSFGPNARPPTGIIGFVPAPTRRTSSTPMSGIAPSPSPLSRPAHAPPSTTSSALSSAPVPKFDPPASTPTPIPSQFNATSQSAPPSTLAAASPPPPPRAAEPTPSPNTPATPINSSGSIPPTSLSSATPSSHSSPILTPQSPTTTATTLSVGEDILSSGVGVELAPSVPSTPASKPITSSPATSIAVPKKSWADLLKSPTPAASSSTSSPVSFGTSTVVNGSSLVSPNQSTKPRTLEEILNGVETVKEIPSIVPRGLINNGNLCFANAILQVLVYCPPFWNLVERIGKETKGDLSGSLSPSMDAMILFLEEFRSVQRPSVIPSSSSLSTSTALATSTATMSISPSTSRHGSKPSLPHMPPPPALPAISSASSSTTVSPTLPPSASAPNLLQPSPSISTASANTYIPPPAAVAADPFVPEQVYESLKANKRFDAMRRGHQEDAEEFLGFFLDTLHEELLGIVDRADQRARDVAVSNGAAGQGAKEDPRYQNSEQKSLMNNSKEPDTWLEVGSKGRTATSRTIQTETRESALTKIFGGQLRSVLRCSGQKDSITLEPYQRLQLDIQPDHVLTIEDALSNLTLPEPLPDFVSRSGLRVEATKQVFLETFPPVLILHLKRFLYDNVGGVQKSGKEVGYGTELEIGNEVMAPTKRTGEVVKYKLFGVVYHHGKSAQGGHYTVAVRHHVPSNSWIHIDDTSIRPILPGDVAVKGGGRRGLKSTTNGDGTDKGAYLLLYTRD